MNNVKALNNKSVETFDLKTIEGERPDSYILSIEPNGGGANIYGPFEHGEALEAAALLVEDYLQDEIHVRPIAEAIEVFCD